MTVRAGARDRWCACGTLGSCGSWSAILYVFVHCLPLSVSKCDCDYLAGKGKVDRYLRGHEGEAERVELEVRVAAEREEVRRVVHHPATAWGLDGDVFGFQLAVPAEDFEAEQHGLALRLRVALNVSIPCAMYNTLFSMRTSSLSYTSLYTTKGCLNIRTAST